MEKLEKSVIQVLIDRYGYSVLEIRINGIDNTWCVSKADGNSMEYLVFCSSGNHKYFPQYKQWILEKTMGTNMYVNVYEVFMDRVNNNGVEAYGNMVSIDFVGKRMTMVGQVGQHIINELQYALNRQIAEAHAKSNYFADNKIIIMLMAINIVVYIFEAFLNMKVGAGLLDIDVSVVYKLGALTNISYIDGEIYRFITNMFLHGGITHLICNMYALFAIGPLVRQVYGEKKFLVIYFGSGLTASILTSFTLQGVAVGASGAIFGLLGATLVFAFRAKKKIGKELLFNILSVIAVNIFIGMSIKNISNMAHMTGLMGGMFIGSIMYVYNYNKK